MKFKRRYKFWNVFLVILGIFMLLALVSVVGMSLISEADKKKMGGNFTSSYYIKACTNLFFYSLFYWVTLNYYFHFITTKQKFFSYFKVSLIALVVCVGYHLGINYSIDYKGPTNEYNHNVSLVLFSVTLNSIFFMGISLLIAYLTNLRDGQKQRKILEAQKMQLEVEKSQANFNFLKAQINPHFLHNTLNFLYAKSLPYSPELSEGILTLSDIMRYALSEGNARDGRAPLKDEIEHVRNVIKINQLRFSNNLNVNFEVTGVINGAMIIPFVLITLVENAFKHGDLKKQEYPIDIRLKVDGNKLHFYCRNRKKSGPKELSTGIGLENIRKRLDLAYGEHYTFLVKDEPDFYTTELTINQL